MQAALPDNAQKRIAPFDCVHGRSVMHGLRDKAG